MGVHLALENFQRVMALAPVEPVIINDLATVTEEERKTADRLISTRYESDLLSNEPACECRHTKGGYNLNVICDNCGTPVRHIFDQELYPLIWMRSPHGVQKLINPKVLNQLSMKFTKSGFNLIEWLCNTDYHPNVNQPEELKHLMEQGVQRGYNNFVSHFYEYVDILMNLKRYRQNRGRPDDLWQELNEQADCVLSDYVPLPNRSLLVIEKNEVGVFVDPIVTGAVDAIRTMISIDTAQSNFTVRQRENRTAKTLFALAKFYFQMDSEVLASKNGICRKHIYGTRNAYSMRAVISSMTKAHDYEEMHISWAGALTMFEVHLLNKLTRDRPEHPGGMTDNAAIGYLQEKIYEFDPYLYKLLRELIDESPDRGLWWTYQRNPSLERASMQLLKITDVKKDPKDPTNSVSILDVRGWNADFDGDAMNGVLALDNKTARALRPLLPHESVLELNTPRALSDNASLPKPVVSTIAAWYHSSERPPLDPRKQAFLNSLPDA